MTHYRPSSKTSDFFIANHAKGKRRGALHPFSLYRPLSNGSCWICTSGYHRTCAARCSGRVAAGWQLKVWIGIEQHVVAVDRPSGCHVASVAATVGHCWGCRIRIPTRVDTALGYRCEGRTLRFCWAAGPLGNILVGVSHLNGRWRCFTNDWGFGEAGIYIFVVLTGTRGWWLRCRTSADRRRLQGSAGYIQW